MSAIRVSKDILIWALSRSGQSMESLLPEFPRLAEWIRGTKDPTLPQLEAFARTTHTPFGFLFLPHPPQENMPIPHFRTADGIRPHAPSSELLDTIYTMQLRQAWMRGDVLEQALDPLAFVGSARVGDAPDEVARSMRGILGFKDDWAAEERTWSDALRRLRESLETSGILVAMNGIVGNNTHRKLDPREFRGFVLVDEYAPLVFVNNADAKAAQMFTLAHELAHIFFGSSAAFDLSRLMPARDKTEEACNAAAAEFLVPARLLRQVWPSVNDIARPFQAIARRFKVSEIVAARRALDLRLIDRETFFAFYKEYIAADRRKSKEAPGGGDFYLNQNLRVGVRFGTAVARAVKERRLDFAEAYRMTGLHGKSFEQFSALLGVRGN